MCVPPGKSRRQALPSTCPPGTPGGCGDSRGWARLREGNGGASRRGRSRGGGCGRAAGGKLKWFHAGATRSGLTALAGLASPTGPRRAQSTTEPWWLAEPRCSAFRGQCPGDRSSAPSNLSYKRRAAPRPPPASRPALSSWATRSLRLCPGHSSHSPLALFSQPHFASNCPFVSSACSLLQSDTSRWRQPLRLSGCLGRVAAGCYRRILPTLDTFRCLPPTRLSPLHALSYCQPAAGSPAFRFR